MPLPLRTDRTIIRRFMYGDIDDLLVLTGHPSVARETPNIPRDREKLMDYVDTQNSYGLFEKGKCFDLAVELRETARVIGLLTLVGDGERQGEIGWGFDIAHRGRGLATEAARRLIAFAFEECGFHRIYAGTTADNERSWRLMERLGMRKEAHFLKAHGPAEPGGDWIDTVRYAILAEEWTASGVDDASPNNA